MVIHIPFQCYLLNSQENFGIQTLHHTYNTRGGRWHTQHMNVIRHQINRQQSKTKKTSP